MSERRAPLRARDDVALVLLERRDLVLGHDVVDVVVVVAVTIAVARVLVARRVALALALGPIQIVVAVPRAVVRVRDDEVQILLLALAVCFQLRLLLFLLDYLGHRDSLAYYRRWRGRRPGGKLGSYAVQGRSKLPQRCSARLLGLFAHGC